MLVLSRQEGQQIVIGDRIVVTVVRVRAGQIRLGIEAPKDVPVWRSELAVGQVSNLPALAVGQDNLPSGRLETCPTGGFQSAGAFSPAGAKA